MGEPWRSPVKHILLVSIVSTVILVASIAVFMIRSNPSETEPVAPPARQTIALLRTSTSTSTLFCEFNNFADQTPLVGFYFRVKGERSAPFVSLLFQREQDGSQTDFGGPDVPSPHWVFDGSSSPATIRAAEGDMQINLYGYDPQKPGTIWFEAGLRSIRYKNLGGRCRQSAGA